MQSWKKNSRRHWRTFSILMSKCKKIFWHLSAISWRPLKEKKNSLPTETNAEYFTRNSDTYKQAPSNKYPFQLTHQKGRKLVLNKISMIISSFHETFSWFLTSCISWFVSALFVIHKFDCDFFIHSILNVWYTCHRKCQMRTYCCLMDQPRENSWLYRGDLKLPVLSYDINNICTSVCAFLCLLSVWLYNGMNMKMNSFLWQPCALPQQYFLSSVFGLPIFFSVKCFQHKSWFKKNDGNFFARMQAGKNIIEIKFMRLSFVCSFSKVFRDDEVEAFAGSDFFRDGNLSWLEFLKNILGS